MVETMLKLHKDLPETQPPHEQESVQRQIAATGKQTDELAYELYGLSQEYESSAELLGEWQQNTSVPTGSYPGCSWSSVT